MRPRFSLQLLLILFTIIAVVLGGAANFVWQVKSQVQRHKAAVARIEGLEYHFGGATNEEDYRDQSLFAKISRAWIDQDAYVFGMPICFYGPESPEKIQQALQASRDLFGLPSLSLRIERLDCETIERLQQVKNLRELDIECAEIDPEASSRLSVLYAIERLTLFKPVSDEVIEAISKLPHLQRLEIDVSRVSKSGATHLGNLYCQDNRSPVITLCNNSPSLEATRALCNTCCLHALCFQDLTLTDDILREFQSSASPEKLFIRNCALPDTFCKRVASMPNLYCLWMDWPTSLSTETLDDLHSSTCLEELDLHAYGDDNLEISAFRSPASLKKLTFNRPIRLDAVRSILASAPHCVVDVQNHQGPNSDGEVGTRYRTAGGTIQSFTYRDYYEENRWQTVSQ